MFPGACSERPRSCPVPCRAIEITARATCLSRQSCDRCAEWFLPILASKRFVAEADPGANCHCGGSGAKRSERAPGPEYKVGGGAAPVSASVGPSFGTRSKIALATANAFRPSARCHGTDVAGTAKSGPSVTHPCAASITCTGVAQCFREIVHSASRADRLNDVAEGWSYSRQLRSKIIIPMLVGIRRRSLRTAASARCNILRQLDCAACAANAASAAASAWTFAVTAAPSPCRCAIQLGSL